MGGILSLGNSGDNSNSYYNTTQATNSNTVTSGVNTKKPVKLSPHGSGLRMCAF